MVMVILVSLALRLGASTLVGLSLSDWIGTTAPNRNRAAREAAQIGLARIVSELNRERNRRLLLSPEALTANDGSNRAQIESAAIANIHRSLCTAEAPLISPDVLPSVLTAEQSLDAERSYKLHSISLTTAPSTETTSSTGNLRIEILGLARDNGKLTSVTLREELEIVPKPCWRSYQGSFGNDPRAAANGLGLVAGASEDNSGEFTITNASSKISTDTSSGAAVPFVFCAGPASCSTENFNKNLATTIKTKPIDLPEEKISDLIQLSAIVPDGTEAIKVDCTASTSSDCNVTISSSVTLLTTSGYGSWPTELRKVCRQGTPLLPGTGTTSAIACTLNNLNLSNNLSIDTSSETSLRLYFPSSANINLSKLKHSNGATTNLLVLGCTSSPCSQTISIGDSTLSPSPRFVYFPRGTVSLGGAFHGVLWANRIISASGNSDIVIPSTGPTQVASLLGTAATIPLTTSKWIDHTARAVKSMRWLQ